MRKEEIDENQLAGKIAVVFDVLLATSTITAALYDGAKEVIPVLDGEEARTVANQKEDGSYLLVGEYEGRTIKGFYDPSPLQLKGNVGGKSMILSTTNGTVAVRKSASAKKVYMASLLNGKAVANKIAKDHRDETIVIVCSGSTGSFCVEDFYGAGYFLNCLLKEAEEEWNLTDAALAAQQFYEAKSHQCETVLEESRVGQMLARFGFTEEIRFTAQRGIFPIVPYLNGEAIVPDSSI